MEHNFVIDGMARSFRRIVCTGDGACMFNSLSMAMFGTEAYSLSIRLDIVRHIIANFDDYSPHVCAQHFCEHQMSDAPTADDYFRYMSKPYVMGDYLELTAAAALFQVRIIVIRQGNVEYNVGCPEWATIVLDFSGDRNSGHYNLLWPNENRCS